MAEVQRGNVFLTVSEDEINKYMAKGFSVVDERGRVIRQSVPTELGPLQKAYSEHVETIKKLTAEVEKLKSELEIAKAGAKKAPAKADPEEEDKGWDDWADAEEVEEKPVKKVKKSKS